MNLKIKVREERTWRWCSGESVFFLAIGGLIVPTRLGPLERAWMTLGRAISFVTTPVVMAVLYFGIITPVGLLRRVFAHKPIVHRESTNGYWKTRESGRSSSMAQQS